MRMSGGFYIWELKRILQLTISQCKSSNQIVFLLTSTKVLGSGQKVRALKKLGSG